jgi:hypothetical protein
MLPIKGYCETNLEEKNKKMSIIFVEEISIYPGNVLLKG